MSELFGGTLGFVPAFKGRELALESGSRAAQGFARGMQINQGQQRIDAEAEQAARAERMQMAAVAANQQMMDGLSSLRDDTGTIDPDKAINYFTKNFQYFVNPATSKNATQALTVFGRAKAAQLKMQDLENKSLQNTAIARTANAFIKRLTELPGEDFAAIASMTDDPNTGLPTKEKFEALRLAEERVRVQKENERTTAEISAAERGDVPTTTITDKGVTTTFKPAPASPESESPKTMTLEGGTTIAWVPGSKAIHVIKDGKKDDWTPFQLATFAKNMDDKDPRKKQITEFLANSAVAQTAPNAPAASSVVRVNTKEERDKLEAGTTYIGPDGKSYIKQ